MDVLRFRIYHAWINQVPDGTAAEDLPDLVGEHAISRLELAVPIIGPSIHEEWIALACKGRMFEENLSQVDALWYLADV